jgi:hypothetical protein
MQAFFFITFINFIQIQYTFLLSPWRRMGKGFIAPHILHLNTKWKEVVKFTTHPLHHLRKISIFHCVVCWVGPKCRSLWFASGKDLLLLPRLEPQFFCRPVRCLFTIPNYFFSLSSQITIGVKILLQIRPRNVWKENRNLPNPNTDDWSASRSCRFTNWERT